MKTKEELEELLEEILSVFTEYAQGNGDYSDPGYSMYVIGEIMEKFIKN
jgi:hypothetical protein